MYLFLLQYYRYILGRIGGLVGRGGSLKNRWRLRGLVSLATKPQTTG